ncbi:MAG: type II toxin-antitoxin system VapC family toxin [Dehalococcoidia bacterium]
MPSFRPNPRRAFLDASGFLAAVSTRDRYHQQAREAWQSIITQRLRTFTTNFVLAETHALFLTRLSYEAAAAFPQDIRKSTTTIVRVAIRDEIRAEAIIFHQNDKRFSFTDATRFAVMERLHIAQALTSDRNFAQHGFIPLYHLER